MNKKPIYLDNSSATRMDERVLEAMKPYLFDTYAVASSEFGYTMGIQSRKALQKARKTLAAIISAQPKEFIFTAGGTESSNIAIKGLVNNSNLKNKNHLITTGIEDFPVLNTMKSLGEKGYKVTFLNVDKNGLINLKELEEAITDSTLLVSIQHANQEIGTVQDIKQIGKLCKSKGVLFHSDATHSFTRLPLDINEFNIDLLTISSHTIHGPKGVGGLFLREKTPLTKWVDGGYQEFNKRAGIENIPGAVGFARAAELVTPEENSRLINLRDLLIEKVLTEIPETTLNGHRTKRLPQNANLTFHQVEGESITLHMDMRGFSLSTGSACFSNSLEASHVILGIGGDHERAHGSVRFSLSRYNTREDIDLVVKEIKDVVEKLREISPLTKKKTEV